MVGPIDVVSELFLSETRFILSTVVFFLQLCCLHYYLLPIIDRQQNKKCFYEAKKTENDSLNRFTQDHIIFSMSSMSVTWIYTLEMLH